MRQLEDAIAALTTAQMILPSALSEPLGVIVKEVIRYRAALRYYADAQHYIDGVPLGEDDEGSLTIPDNGIRAKMALRQLDIIMGKPSMVKDERAETAHYEALMNRLVSFEEETPK